MFVWMGTLAHYHWVYLLNLRRMSVYLYPSMICLMENLVQKKKTFLILKNEISVLQFCYLQFETCDIFDFFSFFVYVRKYDQISCYILAYFLGVFVVRGCESLLTAVAIPYIYNEIK